MASTKKDDITKTGKLSWKDLQNLNNQNSGDDKGITISQEMFEQYKKAHNLNTPERAIEEVIRSNAQHDTVERQSSILQNALRQGNKIDYWGNSIWDDDIAINADVGSSLSDKRAENQWGISQLANGILKGGVLAGTTVLETAGLLWGALEGAAVGLATGSATEALHHLWDNPITQALKKINDLSEEYLPNYYTQDDVDNPWSNIFSANFIGDKLIKNFGFMVGAFYGGAIPSAIIGKAGQRAAAKALSRMAQVNQGTGMRAVDIMEDVAKSGLKGTEAKAEVAARFAKEGLTDMEKGKRMIEGYDKIANIAQSTRNTTMAIGTVGSAINEGAIEAINNSNDWAVTARMEENDRHAQIVDRIHREADNEEQLQYMLNEAEYEHQKILQDIEKSRARMGNADLIMNIPILVASNFFELNQLYARGFDSYRRSMSGIIGDLKNATLKSSRTKTKGVLTSLAKINTEGLEEFLQRAASEGSGNAVSESIRRRIKADKEGYSSNTLKDYILGFGSALIDQLDDPQAWEEYFIGTVSAALGMPVFGSQAKNGVFGFKNGLKGHYDEYMSKKSKEDDLANYLNERVNSGKLEALYGNLRKQVKLDDFLTDAVQNSDKKEYKDIEFEKLFSDIDAAASAGKLPEFIEMIDYVDEYTDEELNDIIKNTKRQVSKKELKQRDENKKTALEEDIRNIEENTNPTEEEKIRLEEDKKELGKINERITKNEYKNTEESYFADANGDLSLNEETRNKMRNILEGNRQRIKDVIHDYLTIRNDIDIETNGRLDRKDIAEYTLWRAKILNMERRSPEMTEHVARNLKGVLDMHIEMVDKYEEDLRKAKEELEKAKGDKAVKAAETKHEKAKSALDSLNNAIKFLEFLTNTRPANKEEAANIREGYEGKKESIKKSRLKRLRDFFDQLVNGEREDENEETENNARTKTFDSRRINSDEIQALLRGEQLTRFLIGSVVEAVKSNKLENNVGIALVHEIMDLHRIAKDKHDYKQAIMKAVGNPDFINKSRRMEEDALTEEEKNNKIKELALRIKGARNMLDLDTIMNDISQGSNELASEAFNKALETADEGTKKFLKAYEQGKALHSDIFSEIMLLKNSDLQMKLAEIVDKQWRFLLGNGEEDLRKNLMERLKKDANTIMKADKAVGGALLKILTKLSKAESTVSTNKAISPAEEKKGQVLDDSDGADLIEAATKGKADKSKEKDNPKENPEDKPEGGEKEGEEVKKDRDSILADIKDYIAKGHAIDKIESLPEDIKNSINKWNTDNPSNKITPDDVLRIYDEYTNEKIRKDSNYSEEEEPEISDSDMESTRKKNMEDNMKVSFISDRVSEYRYGKEEKEEYSPKTKEGEDDELGIAIQSILKNYGAYDFVNHNFLAALFELIMDMESPLRIHFLRSTDTEVDNDGLKAPIFLAIEMTEEVNKAINKNIYNKNSTETPQGLRLVEINGSKYQIVGALSYKGHNASEGLEGIFNQLHNNIIQDTREQIEEERRKDNRQEFVVSNNLRGDFDTLYTGRLDISSSTKAKNGIYELMSGTEEWKNNHSFTFAINMGGNVNYSHSLTDDENAFMVPPSSNWLGKPKNNGAVLLMVKKPDGNFYPILMTKREVGDWMDSNLSILESKLEAYKNGKLDKKDYLGQIFSFIETVADPTKNWSERMAAKEKLTSFFVFRGESPIHFEGNSTRITIKGHGEETLSKDDPIKSFFEILKDKNIKFSLPLHKKGSLPISERSVIEANVFEVGLNSMYNINANFTVMATDGKENIELEVPKETPGRSKPKVRSGIYTLVYEGKENKYIIDEDSRVSKVEGKETVEVVGDEKSFVLGTALAYNNKLGSLLDYLFNNSDFLRTKITEEQREILRGKLAGTEFVKDLVIEVGDKIWIYKEGNADNEHRFELMMRGSKEEEEKVSELIQYMLDNNIGTDPAEDINKAEKNKEENKEKETEEKEDNKGQDNPSKEEHPVQMFVGKTRETLGDSKIEKILVRMEEDDANEVLEILQNAEKENKLSTIISKIGTDGLAKLVKSVKDGEKEGEDYFIENFKDDLNKIYCS